MLSSVNLLVSSSRAVMNHRVRLIKLLVITSFLVVCCHTFLAVYCCRAFLANDSSTTIRLTQQPALNDRTNGTKITPVMEKEERLSKSVIDRVKTFVFFLGHARSGHSIAGSLMDSHPHIVISHEFGLFQKLYNGSLAPTKSQIFNSLWNNSKNSVTTGPRRESVNSKGYNLFIDDLYQGTYVDHIDVIGDKQGRDDATGMLRKSPERWLTAFNILKSLNVTLKVIFVIRNPYDNIATAALYKSDLQQSFGTVKQSNKTYKIEPAIIEDRIKAYFSYHEAIVNAINEYDLDIIEIHTKDLILDPIATLLKICKGVGVKCSEEYLGICSTKIFKGASKTRYKIKWTDEHLQHIQKNIEKYNYLKRYNFIS